VRGIAILTLVLPLLAGCSSVSVNYDYSKEADFSAFQTFHWLPQRAASQPKGAKGSVDPLVAQRIRDAVVAELTAKGLKQSSKPDLHAVYHIVLQDRVQLYNWGGGWGGYRGYGWGWGAGGGGTDVVHYTEGTLVIDLVDTKTEQLVWRGSAKGTINENPSPEELDKSVREVVAKILANYPPPSAR
jgi:hypothetical protein